MAIRWMVLGIVGMSLLGQGPTPPAAVAQTSPQVDPARLEIAPKGLIKLPSLGPREKKTLTYTFKNISATPISVRAVDLAPGVAVEGSVLQRPIPAGASATLEMTLDPTDWVGWQRRNVKLLTDDPRQGHYFLPVELTVRPDLTVDAERKSFGAVFSHESPQLRFLFTRETGEPTRIRLVSELPDYLESEMEVAKNTTELRLCLRPGKVAPGVGLGLETLRIETSAPRQPRFTLYVDWTLKRLVEADPARVVFLDPLQEEAPLQLKRRDGQPFAIERADVEGEGFSVSRPPQGAAPHHRLHIHRKAAQEAKAMLSLRFKGETEVLKVPLVYLPEK